jgi:addiction module RelE/StbE family toxin
MQIQRHKSFDKLYNKLKPAQRKRFGEAIQLFLADPYHPELYNHPLTGQWKGYRSISFGGDWRAHYKTVGNVAIFVAIGTHSQLYK